MLGPSFFFWKRQRPRLWKAPGAIRPRLIGSPLAGSRAHAGDPWWPGIPGRRFSECLGPGRHLLTHFLSPGLFPQGETRTTALGGQKAGKRVKGMGALVKPTRMSGSGRGGLAEGSKGEECITRQARSLKGPRGVSELAPRPTQSHTHPLVLGRHHPRHVTSTRPCCPP